MKRKGFQRLCAPCAGVGERDPMKCTHEQPDDFKGRSAIRATYDSEGRWMVQWKEATGEEWIGCYRLIPV